MTSPAEPCSIRRNGNFSTQHEQSNTERVHQSVLYMACARRSGTTHDVSSTHKVCKASNFRHNRLEHGHALRRDYHAPRRQGDRQKPSERVHHHLATAVQNVDAAEALDTSHDTLQERPTGATQVCHLKKKERWLSGEYCDATLWFPSSRATRRPIKKV